MTARDIEMYVQGMWDLYLELGGDGHQKSYDPLTIEGDRAYSYILDLWDGGREHDMTGHTYEEIANYARKEMAEMIKQDFTFFEPKT